MRLSASQLEQTLDQFEARVLPEGNPAFTELSKLFGDHTFLLDNSGLNIIEEVEGESTQAAEIINLAYWSDETFTSLRTHEPEPTGVLLELKVEH